VRLLEEGQIPFSNTGAHRRVRLGDLMAYRGKRDNERRRALADLTQFSQELGLYDESEKNLPGGDCTRRDEPTPG
jgi:hypothetical protein